jgi:hypothetical protein
LHSVDGDLAVDAFICHGGHPLIPILGMLSQLLCQPNANM